MASAFRIKVKKALLDRGMKNKDLVEIVNNELGYKIDVSYLNKILDGTRNSEKIVSVVCAELGLKKPKTL